MATMAQRAKAIIDAVADRPIPNDKALQVLNAFAFEFGDRVTAYTNEQKAAIFVRWLRREASRIVDSVETSQAAATAIKAARPGADVDLGED